jgi:hypothetical protein
MENLDYHTIMESKIKYYSLKYDPYNKLKRYKSLTPVQIEPVVIRRPARTAKVSQKIYSAFDAMVSFLF